jgi:hypothetical protein
MANVTLLMVEFGHEIIFTTFLLCFNSCGQSHPIAGDIGHPAKLKKIIKQ